MEFLGITPEPHFVRQHLGWPQVDTSPSPHSGGWRLTVVPGEAHQPWQPSATVPVLKSITVIWCHWAQLCVCVCVCVCVNQRGPSIPWSLTSSFSFLTTSQSKIIIFLSPTLDSYSLLGSAIGKKISSFCCPCIIPMYCPDPVFQGFLSHGGMIEVISTWKHGE